MEKIGYRKELVSWRLLQVTVAMKVTAAYASRSFVWDGCWIVGVAGFGL
jgi:hypothetical protein